MNTLFGYWVTCLLPHILILLHAGPSIHQSGNCCLLSHPNSYSLCRILSCTILLKTSCIWQTRGWNVGTHEICLPLACLQVSYHKASAPPWRQERNSEDCGILGILHTQEKCTGIQVRLGRGKSSSQVSALTSCGRARNLLNVCIALSLCQGKGFSPSANGTCVHGLSLTHTLFHKTAFPPNTKTRARQW